MTTFTKVLLSGSVDGRGIKIAAIAATGTTIHATGTSATTIDEIWLYASNTDSADHYLTIEFGGISAPDDDIKLIVPAMKGLALFVPGLVLTGTGAAACTVTAFADTTNKVSVFGYVNRVA